VLAGQRYRYRDEAARLCAAEKDEDRETRTRRRESAERDGARREVEDGGREWPALL